MYEFRLNHKWRRIIHSVLNWPTVLDLRIALQSQPHSVYIRSYQSCTLLAWCTSCVPSMFCVTCRLNLSVCESSSYLCTANCGLSTSTAAGMTYVLPGVDDSLMDSVTIGSTNIGRLSLTSSMYTVTLTTCYVITHVVTVSTIRATSFLPCDCMQCNARYCCRSSVRLSVCPSVTGVDCDKTKWCTTNISIFTKGQSLCYSDTKSGWRATPPFVWNLRSKWPTTFGKRRLRQISAYNVSTVRDSEKVRRKLKIQIFCSYSADMEENVILSAPILIPLRV